HAGVQRAEGRVHRPVDPRRAADLWARRAAAVRVARRWVHSDDARPARALRVGDHHAAPDRVAVRGQHGRQPQRRGGAGHGDQHCRGRRVARVHVHADPHAQEPAGVRAVGRRAGRRPAAGRTAQRADRRGGARAQPAADDRVRLGHRVHGAQGPGAHRVGILPAAPERRGVQLCDARAHDRGRRHCAAEPQHGVRPDPRARGRGEGAQAAARLGLLLRRQGRARQPRSQDKRAAAGRHLARAHRGLFAGVGRGVRGAERRAHSACAVRDCAQPPVGPGRGRRAVAQQGHREAHVAVRAPAQAAGRGARGDAAAGGREHRPRAHARLGRCRARRNNKQPPLRRHAGCAGAPGAAAGAVGLGGAHHAHGAAGDADGHGGVRVERPRARDGRGVL
ncbi:hypothetical protein LPJ66_012044, partial [Kickxella alabastrina]